MNNQETLEKMNKLKLYGMHRAFRTALDNDADTELTSDQLIGQLIDAEFDDRYERKIQRLLKAARFRYKAAIEEVVEDPERELDHTALNRLAEGEYIPKAENVLITGSTGVGKSYIACALGHQACYSAKRVMYFTTSRLLAQLRMAKSEGTYLKEMRKLQRQDLLILEDFGLEPIDPQNGRILLELVEDRYELGATIITSQVPVEGWYELIAEKTLADAVMDRLVHRAHKLDLKGASMRKKKEKKNS